MTTIARRAPRIGWMLVATLALTLNVQAQESPGKPAPAQKDPVPLDTTTIKGQQGLPKVLNIVPWKRSGGGDPPGRPAVSLVDDALAPLDRGEMRRQLRYEHDLQAANEAPATEVKAKEQ